MQSIGGLDPLQQPTKDELDAKTWAMGFLILLCRMMRGETLDRLLHTTQIHCFDD